MPAESRTGTCRMYVTSVTTSVPARRSGKTNGIKAKTYILFGSLQNASASSHLILLVIVTSWLQSNGETLDRSEKNVHFEQNVGHLKGRGDLVVTQHSGYNGLH
jgi:hypothetical protein